MLLLATVALTSWLTVDGTEIFAFSNISYPVNDLGIDKIPEEADFELANLIIQCNMVQTNGNFDYRRSVTFEGGRYDLMQYIMTKDFQGKKELDIVSDQRSWNEMGHRIYCTELARSCSFTYISRKTKSLLTRTIFDTMDLEVGFPFSEEIYHELIAKFQAYFFRLEQQKLISPPDRYVGQGHYIKGLQCDHNLNFWDSEQVLETMLDHNWQDVMMQDARLLETILDHNWREVMEFAIFPHGETKVNGTDLSVSDTVWNTVISVLFNNKWRYNPKTRFPNDLDFWFFNPNSQQIRQRSGAALKHRLGSIRLHFSKLLNHWKATRSFETQLNETGSGYVLDLTALYMFEIWNQNQNDEFINRLFGTFEDDCDANET